MKAVKVNKWMKVFGSIVAATLLVTTLAGVALAQGPDGDGDGVRDLLGTGSGPAWGFVDEDGDGINDRYNQDCDPSTFVDEDGDGVCDLRDGTFGEGYGSRGANATGGAQSYGQWRDRGNGGNSYGDGDGECDPIGDQMMMHGAGWGR
jgi:hypothetical protein